MTKICMMIDLETLSTRVDAVVVSGGWIVFDREAPTYYEISSSSMKLTFQDQIDQGRRIDESTIRWHIANPTQTFDGLFQSRLKNLTDCISLDIRFMEIQEVWSKGANFDISILEHYSPGLWSYKLTRCFRTIQALFPDCYEKNPLAHNALEDARDQAKELWRITQKYLLPTDQQQ